MDFTTDIEHCLEVLHKGGLILYPTDTIWGIGCDATNADAVKKVFALKQRDETKSLIVLLADGRDILKYVSQPDLRIFDFLKTVKKPTTVIYEGVIGLADNLINKDGTVAIRLVSETFCKHLIKRFRKPIVSTSANISGEQTPQFFDAITASIKNGVNYIAEYQRDDKTLKEPSAIIRWTREGMPVVVRE